MPQYNGLSCWIEIENTSTYHGSSNPHTTVATEYHIEAFHDHKTVTCYIAAEVGKSFSVGWKNLSCPAPTAGHVFMDGNECGGRVLYGPSAICARHEGVTDTRTLRQFTFSSLTLTDDDAYLAHSSSHEKLGLIEVAIYPVQIFGFVPVISNSSTLSEIKIHERSKRALTQQIRLAEPKTLSVPQDAVAHRFTGPPIVTFVFRYRPKDMLIAHGIASPPPQLKRKQPAIELPRAPSPDDQDDSSEVEEMQALRAKLDALEAKHVERKRKSHIKEEEENIPPVTEPSQKKAKLRGA
ncbi:hypothetical protein C8F04DRAFT_1145795 [Mycena alexandri]|uniref:DUF7918 domain-containing protein n=1 Tax=Mycena alexandri TaxID=1745969 RepID=A0AAD6S343_9AGAR|nr:hypothetical protein C8F04DRAFT_1145795 [Mycena alexandri]